MYVTTKQCVDLEASAGTASSDSTDAMHCTTLYSTTLECIVVQQRTALYCGPDLRY